jgi:uncharacterized repeat protein (TIGR01451 family)
MVSLERQLKLAVAVMPRTPSAPPATVPAKPPRWLTPAAVRWVIVVCSLLVLRTAQAQSQPPVGRPVLFVHGFCDQAASWGILRDNLIADVQAAQPGLYPTSADQNVYFDGQSVKTWPDGADFLSTVSSSARFFSINFFDEISFGGNGNFSYINPTQVAQVSIANKADELAHVIGAITALTHVKDVIVVAHSMGGLVARAYAAGWAIPYQSAACTDQDQYGCVDEMLKSNSSPTYYEGDIARLITLDTPHSGAILANWAGWVSSLGTWTPIGLEGSCITADTLNRRELQEGSLLIGSLTDDAATPPSGLTIAAIVSYTNSSDGEVRAGTDGVVSAAEQSIQQVAPSVPVTQYYDLQNAFDTVPASCPLSAAPTLYPLHMLGCLGAQTSTEGLLSHQILQSLTGQPTSINVVATLNGNPWPPGSSPLPVAYTLQGYTAQGPNPAPLSGSVIPWTFYDQPGSSIPPAYYVLTYISGGPAATVTVSPYGQNLGVDPATGTDNWAITFTLNFVSSAASPPVVTTGVASNVGANSATLTGTVNPNGSPTTAWFEWGTDSSLTIPNTTQVQTAGLGTAPVNLNSNLVGLLPNTPYYYRIAAGSAAGGSFVRGSILSFYTGAGSLLPAPTLLLPANNSTAVPPPTFTWTAVANATSYRLLVATNAGALPTDPTSSSCGTGCVLDVTPTGTSYTAPAGVISPGTAYYWQVHARSASQYGTWSAVIGFTTTSNGFVQQGSKLVGSGAVGSALQGFSVALSADGNTALVGAIHDNGLAGAAWAFTRNGGAWTQQGSKLVGSGAVGTALQGTSVALSADGNTALVGGYNDNGGVGAVWVFTRSGGVWTQQGSKLVGSGAAGSTRQGSSVTLSADGNTAVVGGYGGGTGGGAWVFTRSGGVWTQQGAKLVGSGAAGDAGQGSSVALSADGNTVVVGGPFDNGRVGAVWVLARSGGVWTQQGSKLVGSGAAGNGAEQGSSVALSAEGNTAIVGGPADNSGSGPGAAWVFTRSGGVWTQQGSKLVGSGGDVQTNLGVSVALSGDGNTAVVGGDGNNAATGASWVFTRSGGVWTQHGAKLVGSGTAGSAEQGFSVALSGDGTTAAVGGYMDNNLAGAAWVFTLPGVAAVTTNPPGLLMVADGTTYYAPQTFDWLPGSSHTLNTVSPQGSAGTRYVFANWSDAGAQSHTITDPTAATAYTADFTTQYSLTTAVAPAGAGTIAANPSSSDGYYNSATSVQLTAAPAAGYSFSAFTGDLSGGVNPQSVTMSTPHSVTADFVPAAALSVASSHSGNFSKGQSNAAYTLAVSNLASAAPTSGQVTVTETVPSGLALVSMSGNGWICSSNVCQRSDLLNPGSSYPAIAVLVNVSSTAASTVTNQVSISGGGSAAASASDLTSTMGPCDINGDGTVNVVDVQLIINEALGVTPAVNDLNGDSVVNVVDVQILINAALGLG